MKIVTAVISPIDVNDIIKRKKYPLKEPVHLLEGESTTMQIVGDEEGYPCNVMLGDVCAHLNGETWQLVY
tara:strand:+ start:367 stop:576 length:210 start_codon:yes stop_codon:yes gene_type:complete